MKPGLLILTSLCSLLLAGCLGKVATDDNFHQRMVVEGRIEEGHGAEVMLSLNFPYTGILDEETLEQVVVRWAKVTVTCGDETEVLTGYYDEDYMTHFVYRGNRIVGKVGRTYGLTVEYSGQTFTATTTIPRPAELEALTAAMVGDSIYTVNARFSTHDGAEAYLFECRTSDAAYFRPAMLGVVSRSLFPDGQAEVTVNHPIDYVHIKDYTQYFRLGEPIEIRFSAIDGFTYDYWSLLENEVLNALNPIFPSNNNLPSNISGGRGIWSGYASRRYKISEPDAS